VSIMVDWVAGLNCSGVVVVRHRGSHGIGEVSTGFVI
jgi:hypothetical protein